MTCLHLQSALFFSLGLPNGTWISTTDWLWLGWKSCTNFSPSTDSELNGRVQFGTFTFPFNVFTTFIFTLSCRDRCYINVFWLIVDVRNGLFTKVTQQSCLRGSKWCVSQFCNANGIQLSTAAVPFSIQYIFCFINKCFWYILEKMCKCALSCFYGWIHCLYSFFLSG